ncbi:MAG TPA: MFS transporter [Usitatibacter sp.]|nr:MFS transporter [Usitatibacter sp.]
MSCVPSALPLAAPPAPPTARARLSPKAAFYLQASITVSFLAGSSAPTPLYSLYQSRWGFSATMLTLVFGVYALAVLAALLVAGRLSDHIGRRPVLFGAIAAQLAAMGLFISAGGVGDLLVARVVQGLSAGAAVAAVGAGLLDLHKAHGPIANAITPPIGTGLGAILAGAMAQYLPQPTHLVYALLGAIFVLQGVGVWLMAETSARRAGAIASLKPRLALAARPRAALLLAIPALVSAWAVAGFYASLGPTLVRGLVGGGSLLVGGLTLFVLAAAAAVTTVLMRDASARNLGVAGAAALVAGVAVAVASLSSHSPAAFFAGTAIAGAGFGAAFQGAIRSIAGEAAPHERAGVLSVAFVVSYLAMGLPAIVAGYFVTRQGNIDATAREFAAAVVALALFALANALRPPRAASTATRLE